MEPIKAVIGKLQPEQRMKTEWKKVRLGEICDYVTSGGTPLASRNDYYNPPVIPWLKTKEVNYSRITKTENFISQKGLDNSSAKLIPENSVIIAMYGQGDTAGRVAINKIPLTTNQACCNFIIDKEKADYNFIYYQLCTLYDKMVSLKSGGAQPNLNAGKLKELEISLPPLETQQKIAEILSAYDDLIENNRKQIKLLEEAAQKLYKEWFVKLNFPGHENVKIVDGVPEGWTTKTIEELGEYLNGYAFKPSDWKTEGLPIIKIKEMNQGITKDTPRNSGEQIPKKYIIKTGDIVFSWSATLAVVIWTGETGLLNQHLFKVTPATSICREFIFQTIKYELDAFSNLTTGATMKHIQRNKLSQLSLAVPDKKIMSLYDKVANPIREKIINSQLSILNLQSARDELLPKLMNGEIEV